MKVGQAVKMAISSIKSNKMRSFLTMLGIIIGVMSVVLLVSLVQGATGSITSELDSLGGSQLTVSITDPNSKLTLSEVNSLADKDEIGRVAPYNSGSGIAKAGGNSEQVSISGITESYTEFSELNILHGRGILDIDNEYRLNVCVIGNSVALDLFGNTDVVGSEIRLAGKDYLIVGVLEEQGASLMGSTDSTVYIPFTNAQRLLYSTGVTSFYVASSSAETLDLAEEMMDTYLLEKTGDSDSFNITNMASIQDTINSVMSTMSLLLAGIAGISLVVGGIGIMNIMLVSVTERTKEIGVRKAIGAQKRDIVTQFMIESVTLSLMGGIIGMVLSMGILGLLTALLADYTFSVSFSVAAIALGFSIIVGLIFGIYPANKAAKLKPIDALRYN